MFKKTIIKYLDKTNEKVDERVASYPYEEPTAIEQIFDLTYSDGAKEHLFDIYRPIGKKEPQPAIVDIHGGAWYSCYKEVNKRFCMELASAGFTVFAINYSLASTVTMKEQIGDIFAFYNWLESNAETFNVDLNKLFLCGDSAGGQLGALSLLTLGDNKRKSFFGVDSSLTFAGACFICGAFDVKGMARHPITRPFFVNLLGKGYWRKSIIDQVDFFYSCPLTFPKTLLISSDDDFLKKHTIKAEKYLLKYGIDCQTLVWGKSKTEKRKLEHVFNVLFPTWEESVETNRQISDFFKKIYRLKEREDNE